MAYDERLAGRVRKVIAERQIREARMFGGAAFFVGGHLACGVIGHELIVRLGRAAAEEAVEQPDVRHMQAGSRTIGGFVMVGGGAIDDDAALASWIERGLAFAAALPPKVDGRQSES